MDLPGASAHGVFNGVMFRTLLTLVKSWIEAAAGGGLVVMPGPIRQERQPSRVGASDTGRTRRSARASSSRSASQAAEEGGEEEMQDEEEEEEDSDDDDRGGRKERGGQRKGRSNTRYVINSESMAKTSRCSCHRGGPPPTSKSAAP